MRCLSLKLLIYQNKINFGTVRINVRLVFFEKILFGSLLIVTTLMNNVNNYLE